MEKIVAAAIKYTTRENPMKEQFVRGPSHDYCRDWFSSNKIYSRVYEQEGFFTSKNRFVCRSEAYEIAKDAGQLISEAWNEILYSYNVNYEV